jgi:hypothetical protein
MPGKHNLQVATLGSSTGMALSGGINPPFGELPLFSTQLLWA